MFGDKELVMPSVNMLGSDVKLNGDISIDGDFRIDGKIYGNIKCTGKITIGAISYIEGQIECKCAEISGEVKGNIKATELITLKESSKITGDINTGKIIIEPGAILFSTCRTESVD